MSRIPALFLLAVLPAVGCSTIGKKRESTPNPNSPAVPWVPPSAEPPEGAKTSAAGEKKAEKTGSLIGQVFGSDGMLRGRTVIELTEVGAKKAPMKVVANKDGAFDVPGLPYGAAYELKATFTHGTQTLTGSTTKTVPNTRIAILLDNVTSKVGQMAAVAPEERPKSEVPTKPDVPKGPVASVPGPGPEADPPPPPAETRPPEETKGTETSGQGATPPADPSLIALPQPNDKGLDLPAVRPPAANVPGPGRPSIQKKPLAPTPTPFPTPPASDLPPSAHLPSTVEAPPGAREEAPPRRLRPSVDVVGDKVSSLVLYDREGKLREYRVPFKNVLLLDFWFADCPACRPAIGELNKWHAEYKKHGLEVIGVSCESHAKTLKEKQDALESGLRKHRLRMDYTETISGGEGPDTVVRDLGIEFFPTMILIDRSGRIVAREGDLRGDRMLRLKWSVYNTLFPGTARGQSPKR